MSCFRDISSRAAVRITARNISFSLEKGRTLLLLRTAVYCLFTTLIHLCYFLGPECIGQKLSKRHAMSTEGHLRAKAGMASDVSCYKLTCLRPFLSRVGAKAFVTIFHVSLFFCFKRFYVKERGLTAATNKFYMLRIRRPLLPSTLPLLRSGKA